MYIFLDIPLGFFGSETNLCHGNTQIAVRRAPKKEYVRNYPLES